MAAPRVVGAGYADEDDGADAETRGMLPDKSLHGVRRPGMAREQAKSTGSHAGHYAKMTWLFRASVFLGLLLVFGITIYSISSLQQVRQELVAIDTLDRLRFDGSGGASLPMVSLFGAKPVADAIKARKSWFRNLADSLDKMSDSVPVSPSWQRYDFFGPVFHLCPNPLQSFGRGDQEKKVCDLATLTNLSSGTCEIISLGSSGVWDFEREIFQQTTCRVHTFDCTGDYPAPSELSSRVFSYKYCIGDEHIGTQFKSYRQLLALAGIKSAPTYFKIDVEGFEWNVFPAIFSTDSSLLPDQIGFEIHYHKLMEQLPWVGSMKAPAEIAIFGETFYQAGYVPIDRRDNRYGVPGEATEFLMAKVL
mmetsp:Transcript_20529/g.57752  ORF Transcript_20529/g.57752 Transcript_20529/m.57752 type:complete len:363 (+) Transcript_20529:85-1173(+)